jgi:hypothetical protein
VLSRPLPTPPPWELVKEFEVSAEHIAAKAKELYDFAKAKAKATKGVG